MKQIDEARTPAEAKVIRKLIDWARNAGLEDNFNQGARGSAFIPRLEHNGIRCWPMSVQAKGLVVIQLRWLRDHEPFSDIPKREELLKRLQQLPEVRVTAAGIDGFPKVPVSVICDEGQFKKLTAILDWIVQEIRTGKVQ